MFILRYRTDNSPNQPSSSDFSTLQTTPEPNSANPLTVQTDTTNSIISSPIRSPKRLRLEKIGKKDNTKITQSKQSSSSSNNSIHCPICLETLDEVNFQKFFKIILLFLNLNTFFG